MIAYNIILKLKSPNLFLCSRTLSSYLHPSIHFKPKSSLLLADKQLAFFSGRGSRYSSVQSSPNEISDNDFRLIYEGPLSKKIRAIKLFSMSTSILSLVCAPVLVFSSNAETSILLKAFLASTVLTLGLSTTFFLHWLTRVYVHKMFFHPHSGTFAVETYNFFGITTRRRFSVADVRIPEVESVFSTFHAHNIRYFLHTDLKEADQILNYVKNFNAEEMQNKLIINKMSLKTLPILFLNLGGEMIYILDQRLRAQNVPEEKSNKVLYDILGSMLNTKFMEELFKPQDAYSRKAMRTVFDRVAHTSIMRLNSASMDKLYDLMTMAFKYQVSLSKHPFEVLMITLNHMDAIRNFAKGSKETLDLVENVYELLRENYIDMSFGQLQIMRHTLMSFLQDLNIRVSIFLKEKSQLLNGRFMLPCGGQLPWGIDVPGTIRLFNENGEQVNTKSFDARFKYNLADKIGSIEPLGDRMTNLGCNMYLVQRSVETIIEKVKTKGTPVLTESESLSNPNQLAKAELKLLEYLISGEKKQDQPSFRLNLFETDEDESAAEEAYCRVRHREILVDATNRKQNNAISQLMEEFSIQRLESASKGDDLLELMDST